MGVHPDVTAIPQEEGPDVLRFVTRDPGAPERMANQLGAITQKGAPLLLIGALPSVSDFVGGRPETDLPLGAEIIQRFSVSTLAWQASSRQSALQAKHELFRFRLAHQNLYYLCLAGKTYRVPPEVGKYFMLRRRHRRVMVYKPESGELTVPAICRPPMLIERALTLCSGMLPRFERSNTRLCYCGIPELIARLACQASCQEGW
jgi:hypothetical protein